MVEPKCSLGSCTNSLDSPEELDTGLCGRHLKQMESNYNFALICWTCGKIIGSYSKRSFHKSVEIKDKYIFAKECQYCSSTVKANSLEYVTIDSLPARNPMHVNEKGKLIENKKLSFK